jgi:hypothetical protein
VKPGALYRAPVGTQRSKHSALADGNWYTYAMIILRTVQCPYCGESFETNVDPSGGSQEYIEDCYVCCRPIVFRLETGADGELTALETRRDQD